jgi:hypothetical protein
VCMLTGDDQQTPRSSNGKRKRENHERGTSGGRALHIRHLHVDRRPKKRYLTRIVPRVSDPLLADEGSDDLRRHAGTKGATLGGGRQTHKSRGRLPGGAARDTKDQVKGGEVRTSNPRLAVRATRGPGGDVEDPDLTLTAAELSVPGRPSLLVSQMTSCLWYPTRLHRVPVSSSISVRCFGSATWPTRLADSQARPPRAHPLATQHGFLCSSAPMLGRGNLLPNSARLPSPPEEGAGFFGRWCRSSIIRIA